jgi:hypothetical protein
LRGHLAEFGVIAAKGISHVEELVERAAADLPAMVQATLGVLLAQLRSLDAAIDELERVIVADHRRDPVSRLAASATAKRRRAAADHALKFGIGKLPIMEARSPGGHHGHCARSTRPSPAREGRRSPTMLRNRRAKSAATGGAHAGERCSTSAGRYSTCTIGALFARQGRMSGALLGVCKSHDPRYVIAIKNEWDRRVHSVILLIEKATGMAIPLLAASEDNPQFYSTISCVIGNTLWTEECCNRELIEFDLVAKKVRQKYDMSPIMGGHLGMRNSFDAVSGFYPVP